MAVNRAISHAFSHAFSQRGLPEFRGPDRARGQLLSGLWMLLLGLIIGCVLTLLYTGTRGGGSGDIGAGIRDLVRERPPQVAPNAPNAPETPESGVKNPLDYYRTLPQVEASSGTTVDQRRIERQPTEEAPEARASIVTTEPRAQVTTRTYYMLQVASLKDFASADGLKAELALQGMESFIQQARVEGRGTHYRVQVGPFWTTGEAADVKSRLIDMGKQPMLIKNPGKG